MVIRVCAFTKNGWKLADTLSEMVTDHLFEKKDDNQILDDWIKDSFDINIPLLFIGSTGIAVRKIAPFVSDKLKDSPVIVMDEKGRFVIPLLSNHVGKANVIAGEIAESINAQVVITTATDVRGAFAIDVFAVNNGLNIVNRDGIKKVSSKLLETGSISICIHPSIEYIENELPSCVKIVDYFGVIERAEGADVVIETQESLPKNGCQNTLLTLAYKPYVLGIGCKKGTDYSKVESGLESITQDNGINISQIAFMASIDIKKKERGLLYLEAKKKLPFVTYSAEELKEAKGNFSESDFVKGITGVGNVCERAAARCAGSGSEIVVEKKAMDGMTFAICKRGKAILTWET